MPLGKRKRVVDGLNYITLRAWLRKLIWRSPPTAYDMQRINSPNLEKMMGETILYQGRPFFTKSPYGFALIFDRRFAFVH